MSICGPNRPTYTLILGSRNIAFLCDQAGRVCSPVLPFYNSAIKLHAGNVLSQIWAEPSLYFTFSHYLCVHIHEPSLQAYIDIGSPLLRTFVTVHGEV